VFTSDQAAQYGGGAMQPVPDVPPEPVPPSEAPPPPGDVPGASSVPADESVSQAAWQFGNEFQRPRAAAPAARKEIRRSAPVADAEPESQFPPPAVPVPRRSPQPSHLYDF
jgi:hypothetical protein